MLIMADVKKARQNDTTYAALKGLFYSLTRSTYVDAHPWLQEYIQNHDYIDQMYDTMYGAIIFDIFKESLDNTEYNARIDAWVRFNEYEFDKLYATLALDYNPLDNYREHKVHTVEGKVEHSTSGSTSTSTSESVTATRSGASEVEYLGSETTSSTPLKEQTVTHKTAPTNVGIAYTDEHPEGAGWLAKDQTVTEYLGSQTAEETTSFSGRKDKTTFDNVQDKTNTQAGASTGTNTVTTDEWKDYREETTEDGCSRGDTSQHLLTEERAVADWSFWNVIFSKYNQFMTTGTYYC